MKPFSVRDRLRYHFDNMMAQGPLVSISWLLLGALAFMLALALTVHFLDLAPHHPDNTPLSWGETAWYAILQTLNANLLMGDFGDTPFLLSVLASTVGGLLIVGSLIGLLTSGIQNRLEQMRKGRSRVVEQDHLVILGWSENIFTILSELVRANPDRRDCIAILAPRDQVSMEDSIREHVGKSHRTRIVCRTGEPIDLHDLSIVNPHAARAVLILPSEDENPDAHVIKTILALTNDPLRRDDRFHIVAQLTDPENLRAARIVGGDEAQLVLANELIAHVIVQTLRQSGLSLICGELLDFDGDEIYFAPVPRLNGQCFGDALLTFEDSALIGVRTSDGRVLINPSMDLTIQPGDRLIAISHQADTILPAPVPGALDLNAIQLNEHPAPATPRRVLMLGWNRWASRIISELDVFVAPGSEVVVVADDPAFESQVVAAGQSLANLRVSFQAGSPGQRATLDGLHVERYNHVLTLSDTDRVSPAQADARTLITLLHLRDIAERQGRSFSIVSEILDERTRRLAEVTRADDFVVSNQLVSLMLAQLAENCEIATVFQELFNPEGAEIYLKPVTDYVLPNHPVNFYTVVEAARRRGETAIGYRLDADSDNAARGYGLKLNPPKSAPVTFTTHDRLIVLAPD